MGSIIEVTLPDGGPVPLDIRPTGGNPSTYPDLVRRFEKFGLDQGMDRFTAWTIALRLANVEVDWAEFDREMGLTGE